MGQDARRPRVVTRCLRQGLFEEADEGRRGTGPGGRPARTAHQQRSAPARDVGSHSFEQCDRSLAVTREPVEGGSSNETSPDHEGRSGVSSAASSDISAPTAGAPRAAALSAAASSSVAMLASGAVGRTGEMQRALLAIGHRVRERAMHRASLPDWGLLVADRGVERMCEVGSRESSSLTRPSLTATSRARTTLSRSPCAAASTSTVGRASAAISRSTSPVSVGRRARRLPTRAHAGCLGTRSVPACAVRVSVRTISRPTSRAKKGLPSVMACSRSSSGTGEARARGGSRRRWRSAREV